MSGTLSVETMVSIQLLDSLIIINIITQHLRKHHPEALAAYEEEKSKKEATIKARKQEEANKNEMDVSVQVFDIQTNGGRQSFLTFLSLKLG